MSGYLQQCPTGSEPVELIIKYRGDLDALPRELFFASEDFGGGFAAVSVSGRDIERLIALPDVIYAERDKKLAFERISGGGEPFYCRTDTRLDGTGVVIGIIDSYIDTTHPLLENAVFYGDTPAVIDPHGTNVAGIAAQVAGGAQIVGVGIDGAARSSDIMRGASALTRLAAGRPLVINISYGTNDGAHTGDSLLEEYLDYISQAQLTAIVTAAGNMGSAARHFYGVSDGERIRAEIEVSDPDFECGIWYDFADEFGLRLTAPNNETYYAAGSGNFYFHGSISIFYEQPVPYMSGARIYAGFSGADKGLWQIELYPVRLATRGKVNIWLGSNFFTAPSRETTVTLPGLAQGVITVGAYDAAGNVPAVFSGVGYAADGLQKPDISAPGVNIYTAAPGGGYAAVSGTSFAAPFVSGACALLMQWGIVEGNDPFMYGQRLKAFLQKGAARKEGVVYPDREWGYGTLCLGETLRILGVEE